MQNAKCKMQNEEMWGGNTAVGRFFHFAFCILHFAFCIFLLP
jgi:hypothetical protein